MEIAQLKAVFETLGVERRCESYKTLVELDARAERLYLVLEGGVVLLYVNPRTGEERAINFFIPSYHPIATVAEAFFYGRPSKYRLVTFTPTTLIEVSKAALFEALEGASWAADFQEYGVRTLLEKNELRARLISLNSEEMLRYLYEALPQITQQVPSKYIANFLGITPQWLSKLKHKL